MPIIDDLVNIVQDDEVQRLAAMLTRFNPFDVLRIGHYELRHTNTLAWLLDPAGNHGLGETFLRAVVHRLDAYQNDQTLANCFESTSDSTVTVRREVPLSLLRTPVREADRLGMNNGAESDDADEPNRIPSAAANRRRTRRNGVIDILIEGDEWVLAIEAKVRSSEANRQLLEYSNALNIYVQGDTARQERRCFKVFLTVDGDDPSDATWKVATWREHVIDPLEAILAIRPDLQSDVRRFLENYQETLRRHAGDGSAAETLAARIAPRFGEKLNSFQNALSNNSLDAAAERVVRRHAPVLQLLRDQLVSKQAARAQQVRQLMQQAGFKPIPGPASYMKFVPTAWLDIFPEMLAAEGRQVTFEFVNRAPRATIKLLVPRLGVDATDKFAQARNKLLDLIQDQSGRYALIFPQAFYKRRRREPPQARPRTKEFFSVYTRSESISDDQGPKAANAFVQISLNRIINDVLPVLNNLMQKAGLK